MEREKGFHRERVLQAPFRGKGRKSLHLKGRKSIRSARGKEARPSQGGKKGCSACLRGKKQDKKKGSRKKEEKEQANCLFQRVGKIRFVELSS